MKIRFDWEVVRHDGEQCGVFIRMDEAVSFAGRAETVRKLPTPDVREWPDAHAEFRTTTGGTPATPEEVVGCW